MFTGLVAEKGTVAAVAARGEGIRFSVRTALADEIADGDSVAVNGVCLTAAAVSGEGFEADVMHETVRRSSLSALEDGDEVNLELALRAADRLGGHVVQGHVDGTGEVAAIEPDGFARVIRIAVVPELLRYVVEKGSIAVDGVSLTVAATGPDWLSVSLIPETLDRTTLGGAAVGTIVNLEVDVFAKYIEKLTTRGAT